MIGDSTRCKCFDAGISAMNTRMTSACTHQFTCAAVEPSASRNVRRNVIISVAMKSAMTIDSIDSFVPSADRPDEGAADEQVEDAGEHGHGKRRQRDAVGVEPARVRSGRRCRGRSRNSTVV